MTTIVVVRRQRVNNTEACNTYSVSQIFQTDAMNFVAPATPSIIGKLMEMFEFELGVWQVEDCERHEELIESG